MLFEDKVKKLRAKLDLTQTQLAKLLKVSQGTIAVWERGVTLCRPEILLKLEKLCAKKGVKINWRR